MTTSGRNAGQIVTAASCFSTWDDYVAGAVMTYYPKKVKKLYFDGTIKLPAYVKCRAFSLSTGMEMPPCRSCGDLFGLNTDLVKKWAYGNCSEAESVSNLFKKEAGVKVQAQPTSEMYTDENRLRVENSVWTHLTNVLRMLKFTWDNNFYTPQTS